MVIYLKAGAESEGSGAEPPQADLCEHIVEQSGSLHNGSGVEPSQPACRETVFEQHRVTLSLGQSLHRYFEPCLRAYRADRVLMSSLVFHGTALAKPFHS